jgi:hypothetical protein
LLADEHVSPKLDLIAGVTDPESFPLLDRGPGEIQVWVDVAARRSPAGRPPASAMARWY